MQLLPSPKENLKDRVKAAKNPLFAGTGEGQFRRALGELLDIPVDDPKPVEPPKPSELTEQQKAEAAKKEKEKVELAAKAAEAAKKAEAGKAAAAKPGH